MFLSCRPFVVNTTFSTGLVGVEVTPTPTVNCPIQGTEVTSTPKRPVENVVLTTGKKHTSVGWDDGGI